MYLPLKIRIYVYTLLLNNSFAPRVLEKTTEAKGIFRYNGHELQSVDSYGLIDTSYSKAA